MSRTGSGPLARGSDAAGWGRQSSRLLRAAVVTAFLGAAQFAVPPAAGQTAPPPYDSFDSPKSLFLESGTVEATNVGATLEDGEPSHGPGGAHSIWFRWTAATSGTASFDTLGSEFDTLVAVYTGRQLRNLTLVARDDDTGDPGRGTSELSFSATAETTYHIAVDGKAGASGDVVLTWNRRSPRNDYLAASQPIEGITGSVDGSLTGATSDGPGNDDEVWYTWRAPEDVLIEFNTLGSPIGSSLLVYTGTDSDDLTFVAGSSDWGGTNDARLSFRASRGTDYHLAVSGYGPTIELPFTMSWLLATPPPNDDFASPQTIEGLGGSVNGTTFASSREEGEPRHDGVYGSGSVWYRWIAPYDGDYVFDASESSFHPVVQAYTGSSLTSLVPRGDPYYEGMDLEATEGTTYRIVVDSSGATGDIRLRWWRFPPDNDDFRDYGLLDGLEGSVRSDNVLATSEPGEPAHAGHPASASVWWSWWAPAEGTAVIETRGSDFDTVLAVYQGEYRQYPFPQLTPVAVDDDGGADGTSTVRFPVRAEQYWIAVDGVDGATGHVTLHYRDVPYVPPNDDFEDARTIRGPSGKLVDQNHRATRQRNEPVHYHAAGDHSVWYSWKAPRDGRLEIHTIPTGLNTAVAVYRGSALSDLRRLASDDNSGDEGNQWTAASSRLDFIAREGVVYHIAVEGALGEEGRFTLNWNLFPLPPSNDQVYRAEPIAGERGRVTGTMFAASIERWEGLLSTEARSVWYVWRAPADDVVAFETDELPRYLQLKVFTGEPGNLQEYAAYGSSLGAGEWLPVPVRSGHRYFIRVFSSREEDRPFVLRWAPKPVPSNDLMAFATHLHGDSGSIEDSNAGAWWEPGEPPFRDVEDDTDGTGRTVWYRWRASQTGPATFHTAGSDFDTSLVIYEEEPDGTRSLMGMNDDALGAGPASRVDFRATAGTTYLIGVGSPIWYQGDLTLSWNRPTPRPPNDDRADATPIEGLEGTVSGTSLWATIEPGEPRPWDSCRGSIWYRWTTPRTGLASVRIEPRGPGELAVFERTDDGSWVRPHWYDSSYSARVSFDAVAGTEYLIQSLECSDWGGVREVSWTQLPPRHDDFDDARAIGGTHGSTDWQDWSHTTVGATPEPGEPDHLDLGNATASVWYRWTAPASGGSMFRLWGSCCDLAAYRGDRVDGLVEVARGHRSWDEMSFEAEAGVTYHIAVVGGNTPSAQGEFQLEWRQDTDRTPPRGSVLIAEGAAVAGDPRLLVDVAGTDPGGAIPRVLVSSQAADSDLGPSRSEEPDLTVWDLSDATYGGSSRNGPRRVYARWVDSSGNRSAIAVDSIVLDTTPPISAAPERAGTSGGCGIDRIGVRIGWGGHDDATGVSGFELHRSTGSGWERVPLHDATVQETSQCLRRGITQRFRVRARDGAGNWGAWAYGAPFTT